MHALPLDAAQQGGESELATLSYCRCFAPPPEMSVDCAHCTSCLSSLDAYPLCDLLPTSEALAHSHAVPPAARTPLSRSEPARPLPCSTAVATATSCIANGSEIESVAGTGKASDGRILTSCSACRSLRVRCLGVRGKARLRCIVEGVDCQHKEGRETGRKISSECVVAFPWFLSPSVFSCQLLFQRTNPLHLLLLVSRMKQLFSLQTIWSDCTLVSVNQVRKNPRSRRSLFRRLRLLPPGWLLLLLAQALRPTVVLHQDPERRR
jgi:hypothetical protein